MRTRKIHGSVAIAATASLVLAACGSGTGGPQSAGSGGLSDGKVVLGLINDQSGVYKDLSGPNSAVAIQMAVDDYKAKYGDKAVAKSIEIVQADHQNKPDVANSKAQEMYDRQKADIILDVPNSAAALAVATQAKNKKRLYINAFTKEVQAAGGTVGQSIASPFPSDNFATFITKAGEGNPKVVGSMHAGGDLINFVKQFNQSPLKGKVTLAVGLMFLTDIHSLGVDQFAGTQFTDAWYWNFDEQNRAWADRFKAKTGTRLTFAHAGNYSAALNYLEAVQEAGTDGADAVVAKLEGKKINDLFLRGGEVRKADHAVTHDVYLAKVKSSAPEEWDYEDIVKTIPAAEAYGPANSACKMG